MTVSNAARLPVFTLAGARLVNVIPGKSVAGAIGRKPPLGTLLDPTNAILTDCEAACTIGNARHTTEKSIAHCLLYDIKLRITGTVIIIGPISDGECEYTL